jgi:hypothetical protein
VPAAAASATIDVGDLQRAIDVRALPEQPIDDLI